ncbi:phosphoglucomutase [Tumebacillus algifaecis]|uniref:Phosphoglucomutase n=1 Tax=Tumebacillus algifaecis TaxID=1214604 RepID=A0A223CXR4_9BACL|nr:phospho-sugar mutase [Tumebacillus algifaecis]ASS73984.1 phosphoglucomutase [Tumebacillus algifaecis]
MKAFDAYREWLNSSFLDEQTRAELRAISDQPEEIHERFYKHLEFGTAGLRGELGAGINRINRYTVRRATEGLARHIAALGDVAKERGVVIAYDSRRLSPELALEAACTLAGNGVRSYLFQKLCPTPVLSYAVRELGAQAGIVITASHNPPAYNGYKVYGADGGQIVAAHADEIQSEIEQVRSLDEVHFCTAKEAEAAGLLCWINEELEARYLEQLQTLCLNREAIADVASQLKIVYTPLHGTGNRPVQRILREVGFTKVYVVPEQALPDPEFSTCKQPNPEEEGAYALAIPIADRIGADLIIATDPDCDRVGMAVRNADGDFVRLTGNQIGALLLYYLLTEQKKRNLLPNGATMIKTIVTSELGRAVAESFGVEVIDTLTGFKYIAEQMRHLEAKRERMFVFGYEESCGFLSAPFVRDKDAVMATMQLCEMAAYYQCKDISLYEALQAIYQEYGYYKEQHLSLTRIGRHGSAEIQEILKTWRLAPPDFIAGQQVTEYRDFQSGVVQDVRAGTETKLNFPKADVLHYTLADGSWFCLRPSGTEPKLKVYLAVCGASSTEADEKLNQLVQAVKANL